MKHVVMKGENEKRENKKIPHNVTERIFGVERRKSRYP